MKKLRECLNCYKKIDFRGKSGLCGVCFPTLFPVRQGTAKGWTIHSSGYLIAFINGNHVYQHRYVMEQYLERTLRKDEQIHHLNGIRKDNRIDNLIIITAQEHGRLHMEENKERLRESRKKYWRNKKNANVLL